MIIYTCDICEKQIGYGDFKVTIEPLKGFYDSDGIKFIGKWHTCKECVAKIAKEMKFRRMHSGDGGEI